MTSIERILEETQSGQLPISKATELIHQLYVRSAKENASRPTEPSGVGDIAIIGMSGRYPQARDLEQFWQNLREGRDSITEVPKDRWDHSRFYDADKSQPGKTYAKWGGFIDGVAEFDPLFFNISPREAQYMDPQERLFLQCVYAAMEDAGYTRDSVGGQKRAVGVFVGVMYQEYQLYGAQEQAHGRGLVLGGSPASIANRVSYFCNFQGPSLAIDTMCSSSLTSIHLACQSLHRGECGLAFAGGVNVSLHPNKFLLLGQGKFASSKGRCESFGVGGEGYVPGEGVGAVLLKPLREALTDGDHIYGIIKSSALNHGGKTNGYTVPNPKAQGELIAGALEKAGVHPRAVSYIEAHGTGTSLGDPIEIAGLARAFASQTQDRQFCAIGSVKSNIGHCESAAGIAGLSKVLLQFKHQQLVPSLHAEVLNPHIDFSNSSFRVQRELQEWVRPTVTLDGQTKVYPRVAGISSFGAGGANAHLVVEEYSAPLPTTITQADGGQPAVIVLSAKSAERLREQMDNLLSALRKRKLSDAELPRIAYTLQLGREPMVERCALLVNSVGDLTEKLTRLLAQETGIENTFRGRVNLEDDTMAVLDGDEDLAEVINAWLKKGKYAKLADLWVKGLTFDWNRLYPGERPQRISLPTYPFSRQKYWPQLGDAMTDSSKDGFVQPALDREESTEPPGNANSAMLVRRWESLKLAEIAQPALQSGNVVIIGGENSGIEQNFQSARFLAVSAKTSVERFQQLLGECGTIDQVIWVAEAGLPAVAAETLIEEQESGVLNCFRLIKALLALGYGSKKLTWNVLTQQTQGLHEAEIIYPAHASLHGLIGSMAKEYPSWGVRLVDLPAEGEWPLNEVLMLPTDPMGDAYLYRHRQWYRQQLVPMGEVEPRGAAPYRRGGLYVVIGGAGGIGEIWTETMISRYQAKVIWIGRRAQDSALQEKLARLAKLGVAPTYFQVDATDREGLQRVRDEIKTQYGSINGLVHSAIVLLDKSLANMDEERFRAGLAAKVDVSVRLAQVFGTESMDFVLFFSSLQSFAKAPGQSNYAAGCTFKDAFANRLAQEWPCAVKIMNWGYWGSVGIVASAAYKERMERQGLRSIEPGEAMEALERLIRGKPLQMAFLKTSKPGMYDSQVQVYPTRHSSLIQYVEAPEIYRDLVRPQLTDDDKSQFASLADSMGKLLWSQLHSLLPWVEAASTLPELKAQVQWPEIYDSWFWFTLEMLVKQGFLGRSGEGYFVLDPPEDSAVLWAEWEQRKPGWLANTEVKAQVALVEATLRALPQILSGQVRATDVMFPNGSMEKVEGIYKLNRVADFFNDILAKGVVAVVKERIRLDPLVQIKILEIGAGTGGTSATVLRELKPYQANIAEYCYSDISRAFLLHAEKTYGIEHPYLTYRIFNVEQPVHPQGLQAGTYDLVIATNVLHATKNIHHTLRNTKACLAGNGLLFLNEMGPGSLFAHLTFGLLEGWWRYEDGELRIPGCPALAPESWLAALQAEGFAQVRFPAEAEHAALSQLIAVAESDAMVWQKQAELLPAKTTSTSIQPAQAPKVIQNIPVPTAHSAAGDQRVEVRSLEERVREIVVSQLSSALKLDPDSVDARTPFADYGVDSITGVQFVQTLNKTFGTTLEVTTLYDYSSVNKLVAHIVPRVPDGFSQSLTTTSLHSQNSAQAIPLHNGAVSAKTAASPVFPESSIRLAAEASSEKDAPSDQDDRIAIIGISGRFPGSASIDELWSHLAQGHDLVQKVSRWDFSDYADDQCRHGGFLDDIDKFDSMFFNISGLEATFTDPQQRLFLEESWKALEDAGYAGSTANGRRCGVYVGCHNSEYSTLFYGQDVPAQSMWGNALSVVPARISYFLDLQGPAISIDTACSSSLVSIHLACQGLRNKETDMAIAGGVCVQCSPFFFHSGSRAGMMSGTGRCHTFDARADGFVPGEAVGAVVLKRLKDALADGDTIRAVIRGSGINQDGATNGLTAPSALSQERLVRHVYDTFNVHPDQIQMVEAHGTGTILGDPIEFNALTRAFRKDTVKESYCAIGSIKTNIGHASTAAGIAGVAKIVASLQNKKIPASLHFQTPNPNIQFDRSPFYVSTELESWDVAPGEKRCAAISGFGFSGTNAHLVIEEAPVRHRRHEQSPAYLIVLSAQTSQQLAQQVENLIRRARADNGLDCGNMSYTLLMGRRHLNHRLACIAQHLHGLIAALEAWLKHGEHSDVVTGLVRDKRPEQLSLKNEGEGLIEKCRKGVGVLEYREALGVIAKLYCLGYELTFSKLFGDGYSRIPLPAYPFARDKYWVEPRAPATESVPSTDYAEAMHPLLHRKTIATFKEQQFSSVFTGEEHFLADHVIQNRRIVPGAAHLEMARAAAVRTKGEVDAAPDTRILLKHVIWARPILMESSPLSVHVSTQPREKDEIGFEIYTERANEDRVVHSQGRAATVPLSVPEHIDLERIRRECIQDTFAGSQCYEMFRGMGLDYGSAHQGIQTLHVGRDAKGNPQAVAYLNLPASVAETEGLYVLHPSVLDSALQASIGLWLAQSTTQTVSGAAKAMLPFALDCLEIFPEARTARIAWIRESAGSNERLRKIDIDIVDDSGRVGVRIVGYAARVIEETLGKSSQTISTRLFEPTWSEVQVSEEGNPEARTRWVIFCPGSIRRECESLKRTYDELLARETHTTEFRWIETTGSVSQSYGQTVAAVIATLQEIVKSRLTDEVLIQVVIEDEVLSGLSGLVQTARLENPNLLVQLIEVAGLADAERVLSRLRESAARIDETMIRYREEKREVRQWTEIAGVGTRPVLPASLWRDLGIYLITGGAGGLGLIFASEIARQVKRPTLILTGRSPLSETIKSSLADLEQEGVRARYCQVDVSDAEAVRKLIDEVKTGYGTLHGVLHCAGALSDSFLINKTQVQVQAVLAAKVAGTSILDAATAGLALDFMVLFSAVAGAIGNVGQGDYAAGNAFMDSFAARRNTEVRKGKRQGRTLSVNWPLWERGGMQIDPSARAAMSDVVGLVAMPTDVGIRALYDAWATEKDQVMVLYGDRRVSGILESPVVKTSRIGAKELHLSTTDATKLEEKAIRFLKTQVASVVKLPAERLNADDAMEKYGIDSVMILQLTNALERSFGSLSKTLFFEYQTMRELAGYFMHSHPERLAALLNIEDEAISARPKRRLTTVLA